MKGMNIMVKVKREIKEREMKKLKGENINITLGEFKDCDRLIIGGVEDIIKFFDNIPNLHKIEDIYINLGPGSFTGARIALLYVRTLAQLNNQIKKLTSYGKSI